MTDLLLMAAGGLVGALGALLGVGGGVVLVPTLVLGFHVPLEQAVPASLMCVVASSSAAAASQLDGRLGDVRLGLTLELATVMGALAGGLVVGHLAPASLALAFGFFTLCAALQMLLGHAPPEQAQAGYVPVRYPLGFSGSFVAGSLSALLGVGGGPLKVPLMSYGMGVPFKVACATSNLMIGVTAAASVAVHAWKGHVRLGLVAPLVVGVLGGAALGGRALPRVSAAVLRRLLALVLLAVAVQMLWKGGAGL